MSSGASVVCSFRSSPSLSTSSHCPPSSSSTRNHERPPPEPRHLSRRHAECVLLVFALDTSSSHLLSSVARKIPFDDPQVLQYVRIGYVASQVILLAVYYFTSLKVRPSPPPCPKKYVSNLYLCRSSARTTRLSSNTVRSIQLFTFKISVQIYLVFSGAIEPDGTSFVEATSPPPAHDLPQSQDPGQLVTTTVRDYDLTETSKLVRFSRSLTALVLTYTPTPILGPGRVHLHRHDGLPPPLP